MPVLASPYATYSVALTGAKICRRAMKHIGKVAEGEDLRPAELADCLEALNWMCDSWNTEGLTLNAVNKNTYSLVADTQTFTIGPGGSFDTIRPPQIEQGQAFILYNGLEYSLKVSTEKEWAAIRLKGITSTLPNMLYYQALSPLGNINLWPPPMSGLSLVLWVKNVFSQIVNPNQIFYFPPGYAEALAWNLAIRICPEFGETVTPEISAMASESKANIKRLNKQPRDIDPDPTMTVNRSWFNIYTGDFTG